MKKRYLLILLPLAYACGFATVQFKLFPYDQIREVRNLISMESILAIRSEDASSLAPIGSIEELDNRLVFLTYGQSNAANTGQLGYEVRRPVFMFYDGQNYTYSDPSLGATGVNGSVWGRVGDALIEKGAADAVFFVNAAWGAASMGELANDHPFDFLESQLTQALETFGRIDGILIHHGERHNKNIKLRPSIGASMYRDDFNVLLSRLRTITDAPVILSQVSYCGPRGFDQDVTDAQDQIIRETDGVFRGPNTDNITDVRDRLPDQCHFSAAGMDVMADMWVNSILSKSEK